MALGNLVANAIHHGSDPLLVSLSKSDDEVVVAVTNAGDPIPEVRLRILFEPYRRGGGGHGLGLGLYIVSERICDEVRRTASPYSQGLHGSNLPQPCRFSFISWNRPSRSAAR